MDIVEEFNKLNQSGIVHAYRLKFEELKLLMPYMTKEYFVSSFISGLNDELRLTVKMTASHY